MAFTETHQQSLLVLFQRVLFLLRGAPSEVHLLICRPGPGVLYDVDDNTLVSTYAQMSVLK